jgi:membrane associated rhomboid family serine protease
MAILCDHLDREQASTFSLVLNSADIGHHVIGWEGGFRIEVAEIDIDGARDAIYRYLAENPSPRNDESAVADPPKALDLSGVAVALLLLAIHLAVTTSAAPQDYINVFGADARRILGGEWYRCATALLLHADAAHIAGNMAGVALFGGAVCAVTGVGVGWLMILACGVLGNLMNAVAYETGHLSIGASTAIFGAVGIVSAIQAVNAVRTGKGWKRMFLALGAGVTLLGFLGTSARSDVGAHLFGFFNGILLGGAYGLWMKRPLKAKGQVLCGLTAAGTLVMAWLSGVLR